MSGSRKKKISIARLEDAIVSLTGENESGNMEYCRLTLILHALQQQDPYVILSKSMLQTLKPELFRIIVFPSPWRLRKKQVLAIQILGIIGTMDKEIPKFLQERYKRNIRFAEECEALQDAIDMLNRRNRPAMHVLFALTKTIKQETPIENVRFTLLNLSALIQMKNAATLSYQEAKEIYTWLQEQHFEDAETNTLVTTVLSQLKYIYPMM